MSDWSIYKLFVPIRDGTWLSPNKDIRVCLLDMNHDSTINAFWVVNNKKIRKWCKFVSHFLFNNTYGLPVFTMVTKCPNQVFYDWLVLNRGWKRDSKQILILEEICSTWSLVDLKTRFARWITRNEVTGVRMFNLSYFITRTAYLCSQWTPNVQIKYFMFDWSLYPMCVQNRGWKRDSLQIMMFVYVCSKWRMVELKTRF
jgi:hypothetical protein